MNISPGLSVPNFKIILVCKRNQTVIVQSDDDDDVNPCSDVNCFILRLTGGFDQRASPLQLSSFSKSAFSRIAVEASQLSFKSVFPTRERRYYRREGLKSNKHGGTTWS